MDLKQVYEALEKVENGAELITAIKTELGKVNAEAKGHREKSDKAALERPSKNGVSFNHICTQNKCCH